MSSLDHISARFFTSSAFSTYRISLRTGSSMYSLFGSYSIAIAARESDARTS